MVEREAPAPGVAAGVRALGVVGFEKVKLEHHGIVEVALERLVLAPDQARTVQARTVCLTFYFALHLMFLASL